MRFNLKTTLIGLLSLLLIIIAAQGWLSLSSLKEINSDVAEQATNWVPSIDCVNKVNTDTSDFRIKQAAHILAPTPDEMRQVEAEMATVLQNLEQHRAAYEKLISSEE